AWKLRNRSEPRSPRTEDCINASASKGTNIDVLDAIHRRCEVHPASQMNIRSDWACLGMRRCRRSEGKHIPPLRHEMTKGRRRRVLEIRSAGVSIIDSIANIPREVRREICVVAVEGGPLHSLDGIDLSVAELDVRCVHVG